MTRVAFLVLMAFWIIPITSANADEVRNGGDSRPEWDDASWFTGNRSVNYCVDVGSDFGVTREFAIAQFQNAINIWTEYVEQKKIWPLNSLHRVSTNFSLLEYCNGREDLKIKLGLIDQETRKAKKALALHDPVAFAYRSRFNPRIGWGKGFIWVAKTSPAAEPWSRFPDWSKEDTLLGILVHELGHVFGNSHSDGSIMTKDIVAVLKSKVFNNAPDSPDLGSIDWEIELYACRFCSFVRNGRLSKSPQDAQSKVRNFQFLMGRSPRGDVEAVVNQTELTTDFYVGSLTVKDDVSANVFNFSLNKNSDSIHIGSPVFVSYVAAYGDARQGAFVHFGNLELNNGKSVPIVLERNMNNNQATMSLLNNGTKTTLFATSNYLDAVPSFP